MLISRGKLLASSTAAVAAATIQRFPAGAAEFEYKWATEFTPSHPVAVRAVQAAQRILNETNGRLQIRVFPSGILASSVQQIEQLRLGAIEMAGADYGTVSNTVPVCGITQLAFVFTNRKDAWDAVDGQLGRYLSTAMSKINLYVFNRPWDYGFRQITNNLRPIVVPGDMKGMKIRANPTPNTILMYRTLGASPTVVDGSQMYAAVQTHVVDGADLPLSSVDSFKMYEVLKYVSVTNHVWNGYPMAMNAAAWQKLPAPIRDIVEKNVIAGAELERSDIVKGDAASQRVLEGHGMQFNETQIPAFKAMIRNAGLYTQWRTQYGNEAFHMVEQVVGNL